MPLSKEQKTGLLSRYEEGVASAQHAFVLGYQGISVPQVTELRAKLRESGASYEVVKNTILRRAIEGKPLESVQDAIHGPIAIAFSGGDPVLLAKTLTEFSKDAPVLEFRSGVIEGQPVEAEQIKEIAALPSRDDLIAKLLFLLQSPVTRLVRDLSALTRRFVVALDQVAQKKV